MMGHTRRIIRIKNMSWTSLVVRLLILLALLLLLRSTFPNWRHVTVIPLFDHRGDSNGEILWSINNGKEGCSIPDFDPFDPKFEKIFQHVKRPVCSSKPPVTRIALYENYNPELIINETIAWKYYNASPNYTCCYQKVYRKKSGNPDWGFRLSKCYPMEKETTLSKITEYIYVICKNPAADNEQAEIFYKNVHALLPDKEAVQIRLDLNYLYLERPASILLFGIDSISRINLKRNMPLTAEYMHESDWLELRGYNKIADNTFPNHMAMLTGLNNSQANSLCAPKSKHGLDHCAFIWKEFESRGYVTAYGEDQPLFSTFNFFKKGFYEQPTDYYMRPYFMALEEYFKPIRRVLTASFCAGPLPSAQRIYDYASEFLSKFRNDPYFALFWVNGFSHDSVNLPLTMDEDTTIFIDGLRNSGVLNTSIVFFFSDHGMRYGASRKTLVGFYEERLPFFFAWFPPWFRDKHPDLVQNFRDNSNRLTNPYDFHMTLRHLLSLTNPTPGVEPGTRGCPKCDSLLNPISPLRTCEEASIDPYWCTCGELGEELDTNGPQVLEAANTVVDYLNDVILVNQSVCSRFKLNHIIYYRSLKVGYGFSRGHVISFDTIPGNAAFETVVYEDRHGSLHIEPDISRINMYGTQGNCIKDAELQKYCFCKE